MPNLKIERQHRFNEEANRVYQMPTSMFEQIKNEPSALFETAFKFMTHHANYEVPRLQELKRYYLAQNDIKNKPQSTAVNHSTNRIASAFARYITNIRVGYFLGNDIQFKVNSENEEDTGQLEENVINFNHQVDESYIDEMIKKDLSITGRAYDLVYVDAGTNDLNLAVVDPTTCFVVYDDAIKSQPLMAVRYYQIGILQQDLQEIYEIYTDDMLYRYHTDGGFPDVNSPAPYATLDSQTPLFFGRVPLTEYINNEERTGDWEAELDQIDALDKSISMMADFQDDFDNANIILTGKFANMTAPVFMKDDKGNVIKGKDGQPVILEPPHPDVGPHNHMWYLEPYAMQTGVGQPKQIIQPNAQYLTKQYDSAGWETYTNFLINEIHKYTNTPNVNDPNFASNASGVAMSYKLWGSDQERKIQESLFEKSLNERYLACVNYWQTLHAIHSQLTATELVSALTYTFTPNLPKNDEETSTLIQTLNSTGILSDETLRELAENITGVSAETEQQRVDEQQESAMNKQNGYDLGDFGTGKVFSTGQPAIVQKQPVSNDDEQSSENNKDDES